MCTFLTKRFLVASILLTYCVSLSRLDCPYLYDRQYIRRPALPCRGKLSLLSIWLILPSLVCGGDKANSSFAWQEPSYPLETFSIALNKPLIVSSTVLRNEAGAEPYEDVVRHPILASCLTSLPLPSHLHSRGTPLYLGATSLYRHLLCLGVTEPTPVTVALAIIQECN